MADKQYLIPVIALQTLFPFLVTAEHGQSLATTPGQLTGVWDQAVYH
jgi:hypothetical protein